MLSERGAPAPRRSSYVAYTLQDSQSRRARIDASPMNPREEVDAAAARIQSQARRRKDSARAESQRRQEEEEAASATRIQARVRGRRAERAVYEHKQLRHEAAGYDALLCEAAEKEQAALRLQAHARGRHTRATLSPGSEPRRVRLSPGSEISRAEAAAKEAAEAAAATELAVERAVECAVERELLRLAILKLGDGASLTMEELLATRAALAKYGSLDDAMMAAEAATEAAEAAADAANAAAVAAASRFEEPSWSEAWVDASPALTGSAPSGSAPGSSAPGGSPKANESGGGATGGNGTSLQLTPEARALQARIDSGHPLSTQELRRIRYDLTALDSGGGSGGRAGSAVEGRDVVVPPAQLAHRESFRSTPYHVADHHGRRNLGPLPCTRRAVRWHIPRREDPKGQCKQALRARRAQCARLRRSHLGGARRSKDRQRVHPWMSRPCRQEQPRKASGRRTGGRLDRLIHRLIYRLDQLKSPATCGRV